ncbi:MAG TPA: 2-phosphosulfolactate phosphatase [bacterium]|nr:2-phosphosulfolactate phosphatase [bacterium]HOL48125.1 2-phosphosulfolactate phosphatase [bacterium]HPQ19730.1 2-phosphosulfolactate phosphatase [bacterium]
MRVKIIPYFSFLEQNKNILKELNRNFIIIVIDVLRATSTIVTALYNGALSVIPAETIKEAEKIKNEIKEENVLLCGEENSKKIENFDIGNSPLDYTRENVQNKIIILKTTNGSVVLKKSAEYFKNKMILICSFLNVIYLTEKIKELEKDILIICSGDNNNFSLEDFACAGLMINNLENYEYTDFERAAKLLIINFKNDYRRLFMESSHGRELYEKGFEEDLKFCSDVGIYNIIPFYKNGLIISKYKL